MAIKIEEFFHYAPEIIWAIVGDPGRVDWVAGVASAEFDGEVRRFKMVGAGELAERIVERNEATYRLAYSVVESTPPLAAHLATITLEAKDQGTRLTWTTEVTPEAVEPFIRQGMTACLAKLKTLLSSGE